MHAYLYPGVVLDPNALASNDSSLKLVCNRNRKHDIKHIRVGTLIDCPSFPDSGEAQRLR